MDSVDGLLSLKQSIVFGENFVHFVNNGRQEPLKGESVLTMELPRGGQVFRIPKPAGFFWSHAYKSKLSKRNRNRKIINRRSEGDDDENND